MEPARSIPTPSPPEPAGTASPAVSSVVAQEGPLLFWAVRTVGLVLVLLSLLLLLPRMCRRGRRRGGRYDGLGTAREFPWWPRSTRRDSRTVHVCFELVGGLREDGELELAGVHSIKQLRSQLLLLADELLLDPQDDLGDYSIRYTDRVGLLHEVTDDRTLDVLRQRCTELRVEAGPELSLGSKCSSIGHEPPSSSTTPRECCSSPRESAASAGSGLDVAVSEVCTETPLAPSSRGARNG